MRGTALGENCFAPGCRKGCLLYTSGYSDIAVGAARMLDIEALENFTRPFSAGSYQGLWNRWHNSLTGWFREYLYFPLGGSRRGALRTYVNLSLIHICCTSTASATAATAPP